MKKLSLYLALVVLMLMGTQLSAQQSTPTAADDAAPAKADEGESQEGDPESEGDDQDDNEQAPEDRPSCNCLCRVQMTYQYPPGTRWYYYVCCDPQDGSLNQHKSSPTQLPLGACNGTECHNTQTGEEMCGGRSILEAYASKSMTGPLHQPIPLPHPTRAGDPRAEYAGDDQTLGTIVPAAGVSIYRNFDRVVRLAGTEVYFRLICLRGVLPDGEEFFAFSAIETDRVHDALVRSYPYTIHEVVSLMPGSTFAHALDISKATADLPISESEKKFAQGLSYHNLDGVAP